MKHRTMIIVSSHCLMLSSIVLLGVVGSAFSCGPVTHIEISYRALNNFQDSTHNTSFDTIIRQNPSALEAGSAYPDAFYPTACYNGIYHNISEDTHWTPFIKASINFIHTYYPRPWDVRTQMLIAFLMGSVSHVVADISWHSLGISQGFISAMSKTNYNSNYSNAHQDADVGGDVLNLFQLNLNYSNIIGEWYVPIYDLRGIYREFYGEDRINDSVIETCTKMLYLTKVSERIVAKKYFPISAKASPYLVDELYEYFLGGIEDMSTWTRRIWRQVIEYLDNAETPCELPDNPLFIRCGKKRHSKGPLAVNANGKLPSGKGFFYREPNLQGYSLDDVQVKRDERGVWFRPGPKLQADLGCKIVIFNGLQSMLMAPVTGMPTNTQNTCFEKISTLESHLKSLRFESEKQKRLPQMEKKTVQRKSVKDTPGYPAAVFSVASKYAKLGRAYAVADLDKDGNEDVIIGAPGYYSPSSQQSGMVFILYGTDFGLNVSNPDLAHAADVKIPGPENDEGAHTQFGTSLAVFDLDKDGKLDIAIGAPSYGSANLTYEGRVYIFSIVEREKFTFRGVLMCKETYCNLGSSLSTGDVNSDGFPDLLVASPFAPAGGDQRGFVGAVSAESSYRGKKGLKLVLSVEEAVLTGSQNYSWLGRSMALKTFADREGRQSYVAVGEPSFRKCASPDCSYSPEDIQTIGQVHVLKVDGEKLVPYRRIVGQEAFEMLGSTLAMGRPFDKFTDILAVAGTGMSVKAHVEHVPVEFSQVGSVYLYNISNFYQYPVATFNGDRRFGRFGAQVKFADLNRDGFDDLIIGAPLRTKDFTEELHGAEQGMVYVYLGGPSFPHGEVTTNCGIIHVIEPCPGEKASNVLALDEQQARFGSQIAVVRTKRKVNLLVTAEHSSKGARLSGAVAVFDF